MKRLVIFISLILSCAAMSAENRLFKLNVPTVGDVHINVSDLGAWTLITSVESEADVDFITITIDAQEPSLPPQFELSFDIPQKDISHLWKMNGDSRFKFSPDWTGFMQSNLSIGMPLYQFINDNDQNHLTVACDEVFRDVYSQMAIREENCIIVGKMRFFQTPEAPLCHYSTTIRIDKRNDFWAKCVKESADWVRETAGCDLCTVPEAAFEPLYSSWYQFHQSVFQDEIEAECALASDLGMKTIIIDDGWQTDDTNRGYAFCGDWKVSPRRFPDIKNHIDNVHAMGMRYMMWYSVPFIGYKSENFSKFEGKYLRFDDGLGAAVLDPRFPEVRQFLVDLYVQAMTEMGLDGFKLDFIDSFCFYGEDPAVAQNYAGRDIMTVPAAVDVLLRSVRDALQSINPEVLLEFRQQYVGPAIAQYGNMFRVGDCPGDMQANRIGICNLRLTSGPIAVHSDMIEWNLEESPELCARAIMSAMFGVIQYSLMLRDIPQEHGDVIKHWLQFSQEHRSALLKGEFKPHHPESGYPCVEASDENERIIAVYQENTFVPVGKISKRVYLLNATGSEEVIVELDSAPKSVKAFDMYGNPVKCPKPKKGISRIRIPNSGYLVLIP